jgi:tetratricopeptide (TPR) repeat protein
LILNIRLEENTKENKDGIDDTLALIEHIQWYKKELNPDALHLFWRYVSLACNVKAVSQWNNMYYLRTIQAVDNFLTTSTWDILAVKSEHRDILYAKAYSLYALHENEKVFPAIQDFLDACWRDPVKKTHNDHRDSFRLAETFFMQWETYEAICDYDKAIESYKNYLVFDPGKEDIEESIATCTKLLQSKKKPPK